MRDEKTLIGMPAFNPSTPDADPFELVPYAQSGTSYTAPEQTIERPIRAVMLPPPLEPGRKLHPTMLIRRPTPPEPSRGSMLLAAAVVCYVIALLVILTF
jgi:hypothetical protein